MNPDKRAQLRQDLATLAAHRHHMAERFLAEIDFAEGLFRLQTRKAAGWRKLIDRAWRAVADAVASRRLDRLDKAVRSAEETLGPIGKVAKTYTIHCVGHAHIDMNWMWSWPETVAVTNDTFITALKLMEEFDDFCLTQSQASVYVIARDHNPELFEQIRRRVAEGRWEIAAVHWVEGDKNLSSGESLARHLLYTRRFVKAHFGLEPEQVPLDWEPDTFGHAHTIPAIVARGAVRRYYMCRGGPWEKPPVFWWQAPDGSRILVNLETTWYNGQIVPEMTGALLAFCEKTHLKDWMCVYGVGDHGGGPTRRDVLRAHDMDSWPIYPSFRLTTTRGFYGILEHNGANWPVLDCELNFEFTGCYTTQTAIKKGNRYGENYLLEAETAAALAHRFPREELSRAQPDAAPGPYPAEQLRQAWIGTLFGHFHDILPGSGVRATREYQSALFQKVAATTSMVKTHWLRRLAAAVDTSFAAQPGAPSGPPEQAGTGMGAGAGRGAMFGGLSTAGHVDGGPWGFLVFHPSCWARQEVVRVSLWDVGRPPGGAGRSFVVRTPEGGALPAQRVGEGDYWGHRYVDLAFPASAGALGYTAYVVEEGQVEGFQGAVKVNEEAYGGGHVGPLEMENEFLAVALDRNTGGVVKLLEKATGTDLADADRPMGLLEYVLERPRGMSAWIIGDPQRRICPLEVRSLQWLARGPHVAAVVANMQLNDSTLSVTCALKAGQPWLEIQVDATWLERGGPEIGTPALRMVFPLGLTDAAGRYEIPFGSIRRDLGGGQEVPALRWADVVGQAPGSKARAGCALLNDCKYGHSLDGSTLRLTLIRSSYEPDPLPEIGEHTIRMALVPHGKAITVAELVRLGAAFNHPFQVVSTGVHKGALPAAGAAVASVRPDNVVVSSIKKAEDEEAIIFRLFETDGRPAAARVALDQRFWGRPAEAVEVDLLERPMQNSAAKATKNGFSVAVGAHGIASVRVAFRP